MMSSTGDFLRLTVCETVVRSGDMSGLGLGHAPGFDPALIVSQILAMQSLMYIDLGLWVLVLNGLSGSPVTAVGLEHFFSHRSIRLSSTGGWISIVAFILNSIAGGCFLCVVVERAKKCLDFTATTHLIHLCCTFLYDGFPGSWEWWVINAVSVVVMALLGEFLCMRRELQEYIAIFLTGYTVGLLGIEVDVAL